jgi:hypothetical protein
MNYPNLLPSLTYPTNVICTISEGDTSGCDPPSQPNFSFVPVSGFEPIPEPTRVEVSLIMDRIIFERIASRIDELVQEFDLESHIRESMN